MGNYREGRWKKTIRRRPPLPLVRCGEIPDPSSSLHSSCLDRGRLRTGVRHCTWKRLRSARRAHPKTSSTTRASADVTKNIDPGWIMTRGHFSTLNIDPRVLFQCWKLRPKDVKFIPGVIFQRLDIFFLKLLKTSTHGKLTLLKIDPSYKIFFFTNLSVKFDLWDWSLFTVMLQI